jgi:GT2 family glycosyltransferase
MSAAPTFGTGNWPRQRLSARLFEEIDWAQRELRKLLKLPPRARFTPNARPFTNALAPCAPPSARRPLVSLIVLNKDRADLLDRLLESFHQVNRYPNVELIVVDHGSKDNSVAAASRWQDRLPIAIVASPTNQTFSYSCNRAAERASGEIVVLLNNDVAFSEDVLGRMVDALAAEGGIVGIRLHGAAGGAPYHIGVRPCWNPNHRVVGAFNSTELPGDSLIARQAVHMPAVTGAILMCRRADYLALGGLHEDYIYGYEDVDFCQKARLGSGLKVTCLNDLSAIHREGVSRFALIGEDHRKSWHQQNIKTFNQRFGYALRREIMTSLFSDDGSFLGRRPNIGLAVAPNIQPRFGPLAEALSGMLGWQVRWLGANPDGYNLREADILFVADKSYRLDKVRNRPPMLAAVGWAGAVEDLTPFDIVLDETVFDPAAVGAAATLAALLRSQWGKKHRFCVCAPTGEAERAEALAAALRARGYCARVLCGQHWSLKDGMRDDVLLHLSAADPAPARINLAVGLDGAGMDAALSSGVPEAVADAAIAAADRCHPIRMAAPADPALIVAAEPLENARRGWAAHPDPMYGMLTASGLG